ncbi:hypothetical protein Pelo_13697 [Pelomyxa schiedti]|nr:hypothetical protein Pelo_13697 [Pelomyxa schiedti]
MRGSSDSSSDSDDGASSSGTPYCSNEDNKSSSDDDVDTQSVFTAGDERGGTDSTTHNDGSVFGTGGGCGCGTVAPTSFNCFNWPTSFNFTSTYANTTKTKATATTDSGNSTGMEPTNVFAGMVFKNTECGNSSGYNVGTTANTNTLAFPAIRGVVSSAPPLVSLEDAAVPFSEPVCSFVCKRDEAVPSGFSFQNSIPLLPPPQVSTPSSTPNESAVPICKPPERHLTSEVPKASAPYPVDIPRPPNTTSQQLSQSSADRNSLLSGLQEQREEILPESRLDLLQPDIATKICELYRRRTMLNMCHTSIASDYQRCLNQLKSLETDITELEASCKMMEENSAHAQRNLKILHSHSASKTLYALASLYRDCSECMENSRTCILQKAYDAPVKNNIFDISLKVLDKAADSEFRLDGLVKSFGTAIHHNKNTIATSAIHTSAENHMHSPATYWSRFT